jgi:hypothetical protein
MVHARGRVTAQPPARSQMRTAHPPRKSRLPSSRHPPPRPPRANATPFCPDGNPSKKKAGAPEKDPKARDRMQAMFAKAAGERGGRGVRATALVLDGVSQPACAQHSRSHGAPLEVQCCINFIPVHCRPLHSID